MKSTPASMNIRTVARQLQVAPSTVSRAINRRPGIGAIRRAEILRQVADLGFKPRPRRRSSLGCIALVMITQTAEGPDNDFIRDMLVQGECLAVRRGFRLMPMFVPRDQQSTHMPAAIQEGGVDGILLAGHPTPTFCRRVQSTGVPCVAIHDTAARTGCHSVYENKFQPIAESIRRLVGMGHRDIGLVISDPAPPSVESCCRAYEQTLAEYGIVPRPTWRVEGFPSNFRGGAQGTRLLQQRRQGLTAIVYENDRMAAGGMGELLRHGVRVPQDISLVGCDNDPICEQLEPTLTTVDIRLGQSVELACDLLGQVIARRSPRAGDGLKTQLVVTGDLIWRDSCAPPPRGRATSKSTRSVAS